MHNCPNCGEKTEGSFSKGAIHSAKRDIRLCEKCYEKGYKKQIRNEAIHRMIGVDGWQEVYEAIDAPSEEDLNEEMAEEERKEEEDRKYRE